MNSDIFTGPGDLPTKEQDPDFWRLVSDKNTKKCIVLLILNELRRYNGVDNSYGVLAKLKGYQEFIDMTSTLASSDEEQTLPNDDPFLKAKEVANKKQ